MTTRDASGPRLDELLAELEPEEMSRLVAGESMWYANGVPRLGIPKLKMSDGPIGARGGSFSGGASSVCFPNASTVSATWNPSLIEEMGAVLGAEARTKHCHVLLGPTVNMHRSPLGGRHFECYSEDPCLTARIAVAFVRGLQGQGVAACVKHYVCNDSEFERHTISSEVDERALREIYLVPFEATVKEADAWSVMAAYNRVGGVHCTDHDVLVNGVLKGEWGFDGVVISDWFAARDTVAAATGGLDLEMPGPPRAFGDALAEAVRDGRVPAFVLAEKSRRMLRLLDRTGAFESPREEPPEEAIDRPEHRAVARRVATEGMVLLKNEHAALPLERGTLRRVAVIGPNAEATAEQGGGSARVTPHYRTTVLASLREAFGDAVEISHAPGCSSHKTLPTIDAALVEAPDGSGPGFVADYFASLDLSGEPAHSRRHKTMDFTWAGQAPAGLDPAHFSIRFRGTFVAGVAGPHRFALTSAGRSRLRADGELLVDSWTDPQRGDAWFGTGFEEVEATLPLEAGQRVALEIEWSRDGAVMMGGLKVGHGLPLPADMIGDATAAAREADAAIVVVGLNAEWETEGHDKQDMRLPGRQDELVEAIAAVNPRTIVVLNAGAPLEMPWADDVSAILSAGYGGQEAGRAVAEVLVGDADPGGRLPTTIPMRLEDAPCHAPGDEQVYPGKDGEVVYAEGLLVGHRHYEAHGIAPRFAFGHGLSYARFEWSEPRLSSERFGPDDEALELTLELRNTSERSGHEVVQAYLRPEAPALARPPQELRAFEKCSLAPGESRTVTLRFDRRAVSYWDPKAQAFVAERGAHTLRLGRSSADIVFELPFVVD